MSGHSKWAQIRRQKGVNDAKRGQLFTRLGRELMVAVREGGSPDPNANFRLRMAVQRAREANMPMENIERSIKRAAGGAGGAALEDITYEGYGPNGTAVMVVAMTDNRNRTAAEVRNVFNKNGGNLGESGSVSWIFDRVGVIEISLNGKDADEVSMDAIDAGANDVDPAEDGDESLMVYTDPSLLDTVRETLESKKYMITRVENTLLPKTTVALEEKGATQALRLVEKLEELDDVQNVYTNADIPSEVAENFEG